ncbi:MAG TPA: L,D-transpeptidase family protein [Allosphingosinicella sp.]|jgi:lipoprotein-anchoring transpeptidase ErfK/SrfK
MKRSLLFAAAAGVLLNSANLPASPPPLLLPIPENLAEMEVDWTAAEPDFAPELQPAPPLPAAPPAPPVAAAPEPPPAAPPPPPPPDPDNGVRIVISLPLQKAYVFAGGELVDTTPVSTGKRGYETPAGTFPILQKKVHHRSNKYSNAPMPYMQRLTWGGVALHAGSLPGYPASHGCIRLPRSFAKKLYGLTDFNTLVTITREKPESAEDALALI